MKAIVGKKVGMTQIFEGDKVIPVTVLKAQPLRILSKRTNDKHGYEAVQVGTQNKGAKARAQKEFRGVHEVDVGDEITVASFEVGDKVRVSGISKGKGFQGGVKRHGMAGRNATHGVKHEERTIGSTGSQFPQRVIKGRKMPGRMGATRITTRNLQVVKIDPENHLLALKGAVPGREGTLLEIQAL